MKLGGRVQTQLPQAAHTGIAYYDIQYNINGGSWTTWQQNTTATSATFSDAQNGQTYYLRARATDKAGNVQAWPSSPQTSTTIDSVGPVASVLPMNQVTIGPNINVYWDGTDNAGGSGINTYDIQLIEGDGDWQDWLIGTIAKSATHVTTNYGATYGYRARATDRAGNVQSWTPAQAQATLLTDAASISIEKKVNGFRSNFPPGPVLLANDVVTWTYQVSNSGNAQLENIEVVDSDASIEVDCDEKSSLDIAETMVCTTQGIVQAGIYSNTATVSGNSESVDNLQDSDVSYYFGAEPSISLSKLTNGIDVERDPIPIISIGHAVTWTFALTNSGNISLSEISVYDDNEGAISCLSDTLGPGASMICAIGGTAVAGYYNNEAVVTALSLPEQQVEARASSRYIGVIPLYLPIITSE